MMMISTCGKECRPIAQSLNDIETEHAVIEADCALQVRDLQMDVSNTDARVNRHDLKLALGGYERGGYYEDKPKNEKGGSR